MSEKSVIQPTVSAEDEHHIVSPKIYGLIFITLMVGTFLTVFAATRDFGPFNIVIALGIATIKASLVILFFMHGKYSSKRTKLVIISGFFWLAIMLGLTLADYTSRHPEPSRSHMQTTSPTQLS